MKTCVIYANCQGTAIGRFLRTQDFGKEYDIHTIVNHLFIGEKTDLPIELLQKCDLFIYQPINKKRDIYCTLPEYPNGIANVLPMDCQKISFPYIYNDGANIMYEKGADIVHKDIITEFKEAGIGLEEVLSLFKCKMIAFNLVDRFNDSMEVLEEREKDCNIKVSDVIKKNFRDKKVFLTQNHVTNIVLFHVINSILKETGYQEVEIPKENLLNQVSRPITPYEIEAFRFSYQTVPDEGWFEYYKAMIERIYKGDCRPCNEIYSANLLQV